MSAPRTAPAAPTAPSASHATAGEPRPQGPSPTPRTPPPAEPGPAADPTGDLVRWAVFSCALVPLVLLWYGTSLAGAAGTALGLAAVTGACRLLLRRSERRARVLAGEMPAPHPHRQADEGPPPAARWRGTGPGTAPGTTGEAPRAWETPRHPGGNGLPG
ncbi:hypothetical protein ACFXAZ_34235 [Streptomyces sp. NPDC059477]|uniref:hypothetical protein n=1 Tax=Streptomyces sp. NPDC059477 TaxID=3346847 RepID=UPI0036A41F49